MKVTHTESGESGRFSMTDDTGKEVGEMTYKYLNDTTIDINHTLIDKALRGQDLGLLFVEAGVTFLRDKSLKVKPTCPWIKKVLSENSEYHDVLA